MGPPAWKPLSGEMFATSAVKGHRNRAAPALAGGGGAGSRYHPRMTAELGSILNITDFAGLKDLKVRDLGRRTVI